jgi:uncharacterized protein involved in response to NO
VSATSIDIAFRTSIVRQLAAAPHRLLFFVGATNVVLAMLWWAVWLIDMRWRVIGLTQPAVPAGWLHAIVMQYQVLPAFMFGFLLTVFPRWMNQAPLTRRHYVPVGVGLFGGQVFTLLGATGIAPLLYVGAIFTLIGWAYGVLLLARVVWRDGVQTWHAVSCVVALCIGWMGFYLYATCLYRMDAHVMFAAIKLGGVGLLLPIFFTVCHRMIPFFTSCVYRDYRIVRPMWTLAAFWLLAVVHVGFELRHSYEWLWLTAVPMSLLAAALLWKWRPRARAMPPLLQVLFAGFAWLPIAFALYAVQSVWYVLSGEFILGRAPAHALFIGCFGSLLVAMVTRVTQGHSGRPLELGRVAAFAFLLVQAVAVLRVIAELLPDSLAWQAVAAVAWVIAFLPWVARSIWIYSTPRRDGQPG